MYKILANTVFLGKDIISLPECHSTNDLALERIKNREASEGSIIFCEHQTKGRGQRGNKWESQAEKNLTFSLVLRPVFLDPMEQFDLNIIISNAIRDVLTNYAYGLKVKWPNDIVHESGSKIGGILIENIIGQKGLEYSVVGIGLNINQREFVLTGATSLANLSGFEQDRWEIFRLIIQKIENSYISLKKGHQKEQKQTYINNLFRFNEWHDFEDGGRIRGKITGLSTVGKLIIEKEDGSRNHYGFKEVKFL